MAEWDNSVLALEFEAILESDVNLDLTGFSIPAIDLVFAGAEGHTEPEESDEAYLANEAVSRTGDLWCLDDHRILCGDALASDDLAYLMGEITAAIVFTDPPYNVRIQGHVSGKGAPQASRVRCCFR